MSKKHANSNKKSAKDLIVNEVSSPSKTTQKLGLRGIYIAPKNDEQKKAMQVIHNHDISFLTGMAGSGKSYLAIGLGLMGMLNGKYDRLILTRPYVEAGEHLGYLPGGFNSKIAPFMYPVMEIAASHFGSKVIAEFIDNGNIQVMPLAYMRGVTFSKAFVAADEMQNSTPSQMRMLLTRLGEGSKLVITGDTEQSDLDVSGIKTNGLHDAVERLSDIPELGFYEFSEEANVRSPIVSKIDKKYRTKK